MVLPSYIVLFPPLAMSLGKKGKRGEAPAFFKAVVHRAITAICYMLETRCLLVASQESQNSASLHEFRSCSNSSHFFCWTFPLTFSDLIVSNHFYFSSKQCLQQWHFKPSFIPPCAQGCRSYLTLSKQHTSAVSVL